MNLKWLVLLAALLLCGCRNQQIPVEAAAVSVPAIAVTEPTVSVGFYAPESKIGQATAGAVRAFPLNMEAVSDLRLLGTDILLFSGGDATKLTLLSGESGCIKAQIQLSCALSPEHPATTAGTQSVTYVDEGSNELVFLNGQLEEFRRFPLPKDCKTPAISADGKLLYYCTGKALRVLDLKTGLDRLLRETEFQTLELVALHCGDSVLQCRAVHDDGSSHSLFFAADTGRSLRICDEDIPLWTWGDFYIARHTDGCYTEWLTGIGDSGPRILVPDGEPTAVLPVPEMQGILTFSPRDDGTVFLECYQMETGEKLAQIMLPAISEPLCLRWDEATNTLWFLSADSASGQDVLYAWSLDAAAVLEERTYLQPRWVREHPDLEGLAACSLLAREISARYGVQILIWDDAAAVQPEGYSFVPEYQVPLLRRRLEELDALLSVFPDGFLKAAAASTGGQMTVCLVRSIDGSAGGLQFWDADARAYVAVTVGPEMDRHLYRELFHVIDSRILSTCNAFDNWSKLNPKGFSYDNRFSSTRAEEGNSFLVPDNRYFVDLPAMSGPGADRVGIMEYAMLDGQADLFRSATMQSKLRTLCQGIRQAFDLEKESVVYPWEQYLDTPLNPSP